MTQTTIVCLAIWLFLFALVSLLAVPHGVLILAIAAIVEGILILAGSKLTR